MPVNPYLAEVIALVRMIAERSNLSKATAKDLDTALRQVEAKGRLTRDELMHIAYALPEVAKPLRIYVDA
jgi:dsDNA-specific endonuclease/ATPase MutS2